MTAQFTGIDKFSPLDTGAAISASGDSTAMNSGNFSTAYAQELLIAFAGWQGFNATYNSNWTVPVVSEDHSYIAYSIVSSKQTNISASGTVPSGAWGIIAQGFVGAGQKPHGAGLLLGVG
jgi:hypothetical protein